MMLSNEENDKFIEAVIARDDTLENACEWIGDNLAPDEVFHESQLIEWVREYCSPDEVFSSEALRNHVIQHNSPDEAYSESDLLDWAAGEGPSGVFSFETLVEWAEENGFALLGEKDD